MDNKPSQEVSKADPFARRNALMFVLIGLILGILILEWWLPLFLEHLDTLPPEKSMHIIIRILTLLSVFPLTIGFLLLRHGLKIVRTERFPAPGTRVLKDTPIVRGKEARRRGIVLIIVSFSVMVCGVLNATVLPYELNRVFQKKIHQKAESENRLERTP